MIFIKLAQNQLRVATDISQTFQAYREVFSHAASYAGGGMTWERVNGREYLIKVINRRGGTKSLGPRSEETERNAVEFFSGKARVMARLSKQPDREPAKVPRDRTQALAVADLIRARFPHLPFDEDPMRMFPETVRRVASADLRA